MLNIQHIYLAINKWNGAILFNLVTNAIHPKGDINMIFFKIELEKSIKV